MTGDVGLGIFLTFLAGLFAGNCMLPAKFVRHWQWENIWLVFNLVSLVVLPWLFALIICWKRPCDLREPNASQQLAVPFLFGRRMGSCPDIIWSLYCQAGSRTWLCHYHWLLGCPRNFRPVIL